MTHVAHIAKNKGVLETRSHLVRSIREFFWSRDFFEVETPTILRLPGQEPYLSPMKISIHNEVGKEYNGYLHTSPEYTLKKMLAAGFDKIFSLGKVFRDHESFGGTHNPEFTMIEWYRANADFYAIMDDVEGLFHFLQATLKHNVPNLKLDFERLHMRDAWRKYANVSLDEYLDREKMFELCQQKGYTPKNDELYDDLFYRIFLNEVEPHLGKERPVILHHYPAPMAALSRLSPTDPQYAERFEVYIAGIELANCFGELTDPEEQLVRLQRDRENRIRLGRDVFDIDMEFIEALKTMPPSAGIALGIDRLVQLFASCGDIDDVLVLPASKLFET